MSRAMAIAPTSSAQKIRCHTGDSPSSFEESMSMTRAPESAEVTKKITTSSVATAEVRPDHGSLSRKL